MSPQAEPLIRLALRAIHLLPQGEKNSTEFAYPLSAASPLEGEDARRADEGLAFTHMEFAE